MCVRVHVCVCVCVQARMDTFEFDSVYLTQFKRKIVNNDKMQFECKYYGNFSLVFVIDYCFLVVLLEIFGLKMFHLELRCQCQLY